MSRFFKAFARFIIALPIAAPLLLLGWLLSFVWYPLGILGLTGLWLMGLDEEAQ